MARGRKPQNKKPENFRHANGSGCVCKLSGNRRKPYIAIVTTGFIFDNNTLKSRQVQKSLGTYATREEAESALAEYNLNLYFDIPKELAKNNASIRQVPIPNKVLPLVKIFYDRNNEFLMVKESGARILYNNFVSRDFKRLNKAFETEHRFHDTRHTFITKAHELGLDNLCLKKIVGHTSKDITSRVYTHITMIELYKEICKIDY